MARVLLVAAGGLARETVSSILAAGDHQVVGMLDDSAALQGTQIAGVDVLGRINAAAERDEMLLVTAGPGASRARIVNRLRDLGVGARRYATHVGDSVFIGRGCSIGVGSIVLAGCVLTCDVEIGNHVVLMPRVVLTHDNRLGDFATLAAGVVLGGNTRIGSAAYLGMNASVRQGLRVGEHATLGMGSVLLVDQPAETTWAGNPARSLQRAQNENLHTEKQGVS